MKVLNFKSTIKNIDLLKVVYRPLFNDWIISYYDDYVICQNLKEVKGCLSDICSTLFEF